MASPLLARHRSYPLGARAVLCLSIVGGAAVVTMPRAAQAQLLRGTFGSQSPRTGLAGTGVASASTGLGTAGGSDGVLGTGVGVGTTSPGSGIAGTGLTVNTTKGGVLGTGVAIGTTGPGDGLLGTGLHLGANGGTNGTPTDAPSGPATISQVVSLDLRLSNTVSAVEAMPIRGNNTSELPVPGAAGADAIAVGYGSAAVGASATALGTGASAGGEGSIAIGAGASANQSNAIAVGQGVRTTRTNQVAIGNGDNTYTLAGLPSAASRAAQSGPTSFVTTDASGNLATSNYGPASLAALDGRVGSLENNVAALQRDMRGAFQGTAIALSLSGAVLPAGKAFAVSANFGTYHGETAFGATGIARITDNLYASGGVGFATSGRANVGGRGGLTLAW